MSKKSTTKKSNKAPWGYRVNGQPKKKPGRKKGQKYTAGKVAKKKTKKKARR